MLAGVLMAEVEDLQRHMVLYQTYLNYFERQPETLAKNEENNNKGALSLSLCMQGTLVSGEQINPLPHSRCSPENQVQSSC